MSRIDWSLYDHRLGIDSDTIISEDAGCSHELVRQRRNRLGIPKPPCKPRRTHIEQPFLSMLGEKTDAEIASEFGTSRATVGYWRKKKDIDRFREASMFAAITDEQWATLTFQAVASIAGAASPACATMYYRRNKRHIQRIDGRSKRTAA